MIVNYFTEKILLSESANNELHYSSFGYN
uniref:Uncharacterized protein n=1 Tax=Nelumbo nucifera TaxID=4432 RepID=A0A822Y7R4_NELNU|nr:TPA_asm: hypothetical protein HUJ06_031533 [Nelumbo nucifera]DAD45695.1 TPA_asm: hypothetical protein HUJ06_003925 [Nelumbo nucifera]